ncbi:Gfo/Idh/MocA family protein [Paenibacillus sp. YYML68]|uniref:Gfo/Idh/MocA family protein n=1 Tax=Paenibacillus sp. YYML68 TaxID=2909250 RepID=UPI00248F94E8|nr:Gfo/Idh/MocA family oxidoreductase [Paenibacillus sp. YYML68]
MAKHRFLLIGHGVISKRYRESFAPLANAEIVGVVGRSVEAAEAYAREHGLAHFGTRLEEVAQASGATAVIVCTPNAVHYENVMEAARLGLHCLCEKPLHIDPAKQQEMIDRCAASGVKLGVSYMRRFIPHLQLMKEIVASGKLGRITVVDVKIKHYRSRAYYGDSWHGTVEVDGGGPFIQQGSHIIDLAQWMCEGFAEVLEAKRFQVYHDIEVEDHGYAIIRYANGAVGMIEASTACPGMKQEMIEISGTEGTISATYHELLTFEVPGMEKPVLEPGASDNEKLFARLVADFVASLDEARAPYIDGAAAAKATELITAIYRKAGEPIRMVR